MNLWRIVATRLCRHNSFLGFRCFSTLQKDYYNILGVSKTATTQEIKQAFYNLSKKYHPDVVGSDSTRFIEIKEAYDVLKDEEKREAYDTAFNQSYSDPFCNQRPYSSFSRNPYKTVRRTYEYRSNHHYNQDEIDRIWKQFQKQMKSRLDAEYDAELRQRVQQKNYNDFVKKRMYRWQEYSQEHRNYDPFQNTSNRTSWNLFNRIVLLYFVLFFIVAIFRAVLQPMDHVKDKVVFTKENSDTNNEFNSTERLRRIIETPPTSIESKQHSPLDSSYPYGFPTLEHKD